MTYSDEFSYQSAECPQKPVTLEMRSEPHGRFNYDEYAHVLSVASDHSDDLSFWARWGVNQIMNRMLIWYMNELRFGGEGFLPSDEQDQALDYLRAVGPISRAAEPLKPAPLDFVGRVQDIASCERILSMTQHEDENLLYWAKKGVVLGLDGWKAMSSLAPKIIEVFADMPGEKPNFEAFLPECERLLEAFDH
ncbi:hypothetical protein [Pseudomonas putida]|uniref:Uncharacterized protein n=1 Tax=Pseudomonas putida TaxID=303 RepID=A0A8I1EIK4_PSEPU|nr:hypothetical protein [Pseudomonas putida]MBI6885872.1 hypothetical protein [Pseudomonas putida]